MTAAEHRAQQRGELLLRVDADQAAVEHTLQRLNRPIQAIERWQQGVSRLWPLLSGGLLSVLVLWLSMKLLRMRLPPSAVATRVPHPPSRIDAGRKAGWATSLQRLLATWRLALQLLALMRASGLALGPMLAPPVATPSRGATSSTSQQDPQT